MNAPTTETGMLTVRFTWRAQPRLVISGSRLVVMQWTFATVFLSMPEETWIMSTYLSAILENASTSGNSMDPSTHS